MERKGERGEKVEMKSERKRQLHREQEKEKERITANTSPQPIK